MIGFAHLDLVAVRKNFNNLMQSEKNAGIKKAWYFFHIQDNQIQVIDTLQQFKQVDADYKTRGCTLSQTIIVDKHILKSYKIKSAKMYVYRNEGKVFTNAVNLKNDFVVDTCASALGYLPAGCELIIAEIVL